MPQAQSTLRLSIKVVPSRFGITGYSALETSQSDDAQSVDPVLARGVIFVRALEGSAKNKCLNHPFSTEKMTQTFSRLPWGSCVQVCFRSG
jgi:hypothetical protein